LHALQMASHGMDVKDGQKEKDEKDQGKKEVVVVVEEEQEEEQEELVEEEEEEVGQDTIETNQNDLVSVADDNQDELHLNKSDEMYSKTLKKNLPLEDPKSTLTVEKTTETIVQDDDDDDDNDRGHQDQITTIPKTRVEVVSNTVQVERLETAILSDPVVHTGIVVFSIIVWLLVRKILAIVEDMKELEAEIQQLR